MKPLYEQEFSQQDSQTSVPENHALLTFTLWCGPPPSVLKCGWRVGHRARERSGVVKDERAWGSYPYVSGGFPGRTSHSLCNCNYGRSRALCVIILHNVHLKQYLHMSVQFNIWVTPSSQLQNTPQHGSSGQPIMQHVTKVAGSILETEQLSREKIYFSET